MPTTGSSPADRKFLAEYEGPILTGKVIDLSTGEPSSKEAVRPLLGFSGGGDPPFRGATGRCRGGDFLYETYIRDARDRDGGFIPFLLSLPGGHRISLRYASGEGASRLEIESRLAR